MTIQKFISWSFEKINKQFPQALIAYQFDERVGTHYIKVSPASVYENDAFSEVGWEVKDLYYLHFPIEEGLCFLTDDSLIQLTSPSRIFNPDWAEQIIFEEGSFSTSKSFKPEFNFSDKNLVSDSEKTKSSGSEVFAGNYQYAMAA